MSSIAWSGNSNSACTARSDVAPVQPGHMVQHHLRARHQYRDVMEAIHAAQENGRTTPVVPRMLIPPTIPRRGFPRLLRQGFTARNGYGNFDGWRLAENGGLLADDFLPSSCVAPG